MEDHTCIIITLGRQTLEDRPEGYRGVIRDFARTRREENPWVWWHRCKGLPRLPPEQTEYVYFIVGNKLRWRAAMVQHLRSTGIYDEGAGRSLPPGNWICLTNIEPVPPEHRFTRRGFQGFRYSPRLY